MVIIRQADPYDQTGDATKGVGVAKYDFAMYSVGLFSLNTSDRRQSKTFILSTNVDLRSLETKFLIAVCHLTVNYS